MVKIMANNNKDYYEDEESNRSSIWKTKRVTLKLYKATHAKLKIIASINEKSLDKMASEIVEETVNEIDIVKVVQDGLKELSEPVRFPIDEEMEESINASEEATFPRKKVTIDLEPETHKKLKIIASAEDQSLEYATSMLVDFKIDEIDVVKLVADEFN